MWPENWPVSIGTSISRTYATILANEDRSKELRQPRPSVREHLKQEPKQAAPKAPGHKKLEPER